MSNPIVTIGNSIPTPPDPQVKRVTFTKIQYDSQKFWTYGSGEYDSGYSSFDPKKKGEEFYMFVLLEDVINSRPDFVTQESWVGLKKSASGFITAVNSVMPKIIIPSEKLVDNGVNTPGKGMYAYLLPGMQDLFNWDVVSSPADDNRFGTVNQGAHYGSNYVSCKAKNDTSSSNTTVISLKNPGSPPSGDWQSSNDLVVGGAFVLMLNVVPSRPATADVAQVGKTKWSVLLEFGDVVMDIDDAGSTEIMINTGEKNKTTVNLAEGKTKGGPPQCQHICEKDPFVILVYPVWNGIVVSSGIQDAYATVFSSSYYVPKLKEAAILNSPYSSGFNPQSPSSVLVSSSGVLVDFGNELKLTAKNCRFDVAYLPCFFSKQMIFDEWRLQSADIPGTVTFQYNVYPIWTKNGTSTTLSPSPHVNKTNHPGSISDTIYTYTAWGLKQSKFNRFAGEIFGSILRCIETRDFPIKNDNGSFNITFTGGSAGDPNSTGNWQDYIKSVSVSVSIDGSSGSITVDKFGIAGQNAVPNQSIGAITINASGGFGTVGGSIFQGLALGISDSKSSSGGEWTIPLVGLEQKMEDIALINVPFFDGETLSSAAGFLCKYAGLVADFSHANPSVRLGVTDDVNAVRFDWKAGTTVKSALDEVMDDVLHHYVVRDGKIFFYELSGTTGLPTSGLGTDWKSSYPDVKIVNYDTTPDFEDIRNEIVVLGLEQIPDGKNAEVENLPTFPRVVVKSNIPTTPNIPWSKVMVQPVPGYMRPGDFSSFANKLASMYSVYELTGKTTVPGNANIKPYDQWGDFIIYSVSHNVDLTSKSWTTDLEFMKKTR